MVDTEITGRRDFYRRVRDGETPFIINDVNYIYPNVSIDRCYAFALDDNFINLNNLISSSAAWANIAATYDFFKVTGIEITVSSVFNHGLGALGVSTLFSPPLYVNFFPAVTSTKYNVHRVSSASDCLRVDPYGGTHYRYIPFPENFGIGITGLGTWNPVSRVSSLPGEIAIAGLSTTTAGLTEGIPAFEMLLTVYCVACYERP